MPIRYVSLVVAAVLLTATGCREIVPPAADMGGGSDMGDMGVPVDLGPCGRVCPATEPVCLENADGGTCVDCIEDGDCTSGHCDVPNNTCVSCLEDEHCTTPAAAQCNPTMHVCEGCTSNDQCAQFASSATPTPVCEAQACVQCTHEFPEACGANVCDSTAHVCLDRAKHTKGGCDECVSDDDCMEGMLCIAMTYGVSATPVGNHCLPLASASVGGSCSDEANHPYTAPRAGGMSIDGDSRPVCGLTFATCAAMQQVRVQTCEPSGPAGDEDCGILGVSDGVCIMFGSESRCSVTCDASSAVADCPGAYQCGSTGTRDACVLP